MSSFTMEIRNRINQQPEQISNGVSQSLTQSELQIQSSTLQSRAKNEFGHVTETKLELNGCSDGALSF